jgi:hypothetical protein
LNSPRPFNIRIHVAEGNASGLRLVEKSGWVGLGVVCPKGRYSQVNQRDEFSGSGVYILVGSESESDAPTIYVGQAETLRNRLARHYADPEKEFWQQAIFFTTKGDPLNKSELQYLESSLVKRAQQFRRCRLDNANTPQEPPLSEADRADADGYLQEMLSLLPVLGIKAFEEVEAAPSSRLKFVMQGVDFSGVGYESSEGFIVKKGSQARSHITDAMKKHGVGYARLRDHLIEEDILVAEGEHLVFTVDYEFRAASAAASILAGNNKNGRESWKDETGKMLKQHQEQELSLSESVSE